MPDTACTLPPPGGELHDEVLDAQQRVVAVGPQVRGAGARPSARRDSSPASTCRRPGCARARPSPSGVPTGNQQRYSWPGVGAGEQRRLLLAAAVLHVRAARRRTGSPVGGSTRSGGRPGIAVRRVWLGSAIFGIDRSSASV